MNTLQLYSEQFRYQNKQMTANQLTCLAPPDIPKRKQTQIRRVSEDCLLHNSSSIWNFSMRFFLICSELIAEKEYVKKKFSIF